MQFYCWKQSFLFTSKYVTIDFYPLVSFFEVLQMIQFLIQKYIPEYENVKDPVVRRQYGRLGGIGGLVLNGLLAAAKVLLGLLFGSVAIMADGVNNLTDASSSLITLISFRLAAKPADAEHPFGHARIEFIAGLMVAFMVIFLAFELFLSSFKKILHPEPTDVSTLAMFVLVLAILAKLWQSRFYCKLGNAISSATLLASGQDSRNDVISTSAVLVATAIEKFFGLQIDGYMGVLVALFILYSGIGLIKETAAPLLGELPDKELVDEIEHLITSHEKAIGLHDLIVHNYGPGRTFASVHVEVSAAEDIMESHELMDSIEEEAREKLHIQLVCHMDPLRLDDPFRAEAEQLIRRVLSEIPGVLNFHDLRVVVGPTRSNIVFDVVIPQEFSLSEEELCSLIQQKVHEYNSNYFTVVQVDRSFVSF